MDNDDAVTLMNQMGVKPSNHSTATDELFALLMASDGYPTVDAKTGDYVVMVGGAEVARLV